MIDPRMQIAARRALGLEVPTPGETPMRRRTDRFAIPDPEREAQIERVTLDVRIDDRVESVMLVIRDGELAWTCTDGTVGRESGGATPSAYVRSALRWASGAGAEPLAPRDTRRLSLRAIEAEPAPSAPAEGPRKLAIALDDVITEIARAGLGGRDAPAVREAIDRAARAVSPTPLAVSRWIGRLERALRTVEARMVARLLDGAALAADDLRGASPGARGRVWLGRPEPGSIDQLVDRPMLEVARESVEGAQRSAIERRYVLDLTSGELLCEERARDAGAPSLGPCPRSLAVGLAEAIAGPAPRRLRLLQYTVTLEATEADLERAVASAIRRTAMLVDRYREAIEAWPALAEPVVIVAAAGIEDGFLVDAVGDPIPIARDDDPGAAAALDAATKAGDVEWLVGRLIDHDGAVRLVPCSFARRGKLVRLR